MPLATADVQALYDRCIDKGKPRSGRTIEMIIATLGLILSHARRVGLIETNAVEAWKRGRPKRRRSSMKEITLDEIRCPSCGTTFGLGTLLLLRRLSKEAPPGYPYEQRKRARVPKTLKVSYPTPKGFVDNHISNLSVGGLFVKTSEPLNLGEKLNLKIFLPDKEKELELSGEVIWTNREERMTPEGKLPPGMGVKFLTLSTKDKIRISINILRYYKK